MNIRNTILFVVVLTWVLATLNVNAEVLIVPAPPKIKAKSYMVLDFNSDQILVKENIDEKLPPASLTKIMTVYVVCHELKAGNIRLDDKVIVSEKAWRMTGSRMFIEVGKEVSIEDLLKGVIIQSGNDASVALAEYVSGSEDVFVSIMNKYAKQLGMTNTNYVNSTGLQDEQHYTTARDLAILAKALISQFPDIYGWHSIREFTFNGIKQHNRNKLLWIDQTADGIKTGHTEAAGYCLVASAKRDDMRLISIVLGSEGTNARTKASQSLLNFSFRFYETHKLYNSYDVITSIKIWKGETDTLELGIDHDLYVTVARGQYKHLNTDVEVNPKIVAPVKRGELQGELKVTLSGETLVKDSLIALQSVSEGNLFNRVKDNVLLLFE
jgi:D-alanyl-D-alanine carboxypeptidase (penicillin-binding protein 5/6)